MGTRCSSTVRSAQVLTPIRDELAVITLLWKKNHKAQKPIHLVVLSAENQSLVLFHIALQGVAS